MISLLATAQATLRVIGLAAIIQGNPGIDVVMPRVDTEETQIKEHVPVLIVRKNELVGSTDGWNFKPYPSNAAFKYAELTGEDLEFVPGAPNPVATVPFQLPRLTNGCILELSVKAGEAEGRSQAVQPGALIDVFTLRPPLLEGYRPPFYTAAAAVLRVPSGSTSACMAFVKKKHRERVDTNVAWDTGGGVTIVGKRHATRLRLQGNDVLIVAGNVPRSLLHGSREMHDVGHFRAYYTMLVANGQKGCRPQKPATDIPSCRESSKALQTPPTGSALPVPGVIRIVTSECSNSQYP